MSVQCLLLTWLIVWFASSVASAQDTVPVQPPSAGQVALSDPPPAVPAAPIAPYVTPTSLLQPDAAQQLRSRTLDRAQRRARLLLAIGAGLAVSSGVHYAVASRRRECRNEYYERTHARTSSLRGAMVLGGIGVSLAFGGAAWLPFVSKPHYPAPRSQRVIIAGAALASFAIAQVALWSTFGMQTLACADLAR